MTTTTTTTPVVTGQVDVALPKRRQTVGMRRFGYAVAIAVNVAFIFLINEWPGWSSVVFLTDETETVVPILNAALVISIVANAIYLIADPRWLRAIGDAVTAAVSFIVILVTLRVFPFDFTDYSFDWAMLVQVMLGVGLIGCLVGVIANLVTFTREVGKA
jgi:hypothetical protein